jgi:hypothetical protein
MEANGGLGVRNAWFGCRHMNDRNRRDGVIGDAARSARRPASDPYQNRTLIPILALLLDTLYLPIKVPDVWDVVSLIVPLGKNKCE